MRKKIKCGILYVLAAVLILCGAPIGSFDLSAQTVSAGDNSVLFSEYDYYINGRNDASEDMPVSLETANSDDADFLSEEDGLFWKEGKGSVDFSVTVPESALYHIELVWKAAASGVDPRFELAIDGECPFENAREIVLPREWKNATKEPRKDAQGNEYAQEQIETGENIVTALFDITGVVTEPYKFYFTKGVHTFSFCDLGQGIYIKAVTLKAPERTKSYREVSKDYKLKKTSADIIVLEGENADVKSSKSIIQKSNNSDVGMSPCDAYTTKMNYIGGTAWKEPTSKLTWKFKVLEDGYYFINFRYKQSDLVNGESLRWLKIDGKTPFEEAKTIRFPYGTSWDYLSPGTEKEPYYVYLEKGNHTISLESTLGKQSEYFYRLSKITESLGDEYVKIIMITSETPDLNRDYALFKQIPQFTETLTENRDFLLKLSGDMKESSGKGGTQVTASMENMARVLSNMLRSPYLAHQYVKDYYSNYTSVSAWLHDMTSMPLSLDRIQIVPAGEEYINTNGNIFEKIGHGFIRFLISFTSDYNLSGKGNGQGTVRLWVNWGQDQASALYSLIQDSFTSKTGIRVQIEIVNASLINGILAGNFPDVSLQMARTDPVNLGIRGALYDLRNFKDCNNVLQNFQNGAEKPYAYGDALYALPDTQNYFVMFYRTDVFEQLGLQVPETWDDFIYAANIIQRNNMSVYVPYTQIANSTTVNAGMGNLNLYPTLMSQNGLSLYNDDLTAVAFDTKNAIKVFKEWTDFYTEYNYAKEADFFNRFRSGVMPLGIAPYGTYMTLYSAAPEIRGRWKIALIPGTKCENGEIDHTVAGAGTGCAIIAKSAHKEEAWKFLKWWTSAETQARYSNNVESILGVLGRIHTSNVEAFQKLTWESNALATLNEQWSWVKEIPEIPGSYYSTRAIDQAFWSVVNGESIPKDAVTKWSQVANEEIERKIREYS